MGGGEVFEMLLIKSLICLGLWSSYLLLHNNKPPQIQSLKATTILFAHDSVVSNLVWALPVSPDVMHHIQLVLGRRLIRGTSAGKTHLCHLLSSSSRLAQAPSQDRDARQEDKSRNCAFFGQRMS